MLDRLTVWLAGDFAEDLVPSYFGFTVPLPLFVSLLLLVATGAGVAFFYWRRLGDMLPRTRWTVVTLRAAAFTLALFLLLDPAIIAQRIKPGEQFAVLIFDDSLSMRIRGADGLPRGERLVEDYEKARDSFESRLLRKNQITRYRLGPSIEPLQQVSALDFSQRETDVYGGIAAALADLEGLNVSAVVLFSDGVQQRSRHLTDLEDITRGIPVFTVGVDSDARFRDLELRDLSIQRTYFDKSPVILHANLSSTGLKGRKASVEILMGKRVVKSALIDLTEARQEHQVRLEFVPMRKGWLEYEVRVRLANEPGGAGGVARRGDQIAQNNSRRFVIDNRPKTYRVLYVSGRPNWQNKFVRAALDGDEQLRLTSLISISNAERKFVFRGRRSSMTNPLFEGFDEEHDRPRYDEAVYLRLGADENELVTGYPTNPEELFKYHLIIWGDVEKEFFTAAQLELTRDFVEKRGGSLLLLGGPNGFTGGGFEGTLIEGMLPVKLFADTGARPGQDQRVAEAFHVQPTIEGSLAGAWSLDADPDANARRWSAMPPLFGLNLFALTRPGATVMASAEGGTDAVQNQPVFVSQRYGEGRCAIFATSDTWQWQMRLDVDDDTHERLWRQIVRSLVHGAPVPAFLDSEEDTFKQGSPAALRFKVRDALYDEGEGLRTIITVTTPSEQEMSLPVDESLHTPGLYTAEFSPGETGLYHAHLTAMNDKDEVVSTAEAAVLSEPDQREFRNAQYNPDFLRALSAATGGAFFTLSQLDELARAIPAPARDDAEEVVLHLWHFPGFYAALVLMMAVEWYLRRKSGHP